MDVRCEKCQTEYELDEARLKPGGVTVKCTNCGHMFKIRKRSITNVGAPPAGEQRARTSSSKPPNKPAPPPEVAGLDDAPTRQVTIDDGHTAVDRQWLIRLETGEQRSCRELATLQQWIVSRVVTRESLISRTGKTWKRLGDITELAQYFQIAEEATARPPREDRPTKPTGRPAGQVPGKPAPAPTLLGVGTVTAAGGTIVPDDDDDDDPARSTGNFKAVPRASTPPPPVPPAAAAANKAALAQTMTAPPPPPAAAKAARPKTTPPPPPPAKKPPAGGRSTAAWASDPIKPAAAVTAEPSGPMSGKLAAAPDEPAFAGRVRAAPSAEASFITGKVGRIDDDDDAVLPRRRGSRAGLWILLMTFVVGTAAAAAVYVLVIKKDRAADPPGDGSAIAAAPPDAHGVVIAPIVDAPEAAPLSPAEVARGELAGNNEGRLRAAYDSLAAAEDPAAVAVRAHLGVALAQALADRAGLVERAEADKLRKQSKALVLEAMTAAQKALKATPDAPAANLAMAAVLRLQGKAAREIKPYIDRAKAKAGADWLRDVGIAEAHVLARDGKLADARAAFAAIDDGDGALERSGDVRARFQIALALRALGKPADAGTLVEQILAAQPEHEGARALAAKLDTAVAKTDPLPPEQGGSVAVTPTPTPTPPPPPDRPTPTPTPPPDRPTPTPTPPDVATGGSYDQLVKRANALAETNCGKALELFQKALEQKPNGVEALTGMGYCHIDAKQFASAFSKFRAALATSPRFEPALWGIAEAYQQQGRRDQAIEAYQRYLEVYPGSAKAQKQLDRLGGGGAGGSTPKDPPAPTPTPTPEPAETPAPAPAPAPAPEGE